MEKRGGGEVLMKVMGTKVELQEIRKSYGGDYGGVDVEEEEDKIEAKKDNKEERREGRERVCETGMDGEGYGSSGGRGMKRKRC